MSRGAIDVEPSHPTCLVRATGDHVQKMVGCSDFARSWAVAPLVEFTLPDNGDYLLSHILNTIHL